MDEKKIMTDEEKFQISTENHVSKNEKIYSNQTFFQDACSRFLSRKMSVCCLVILTILFLYAILAPILSSHSFDEVDMLAASLPPKIPGLCKLGVFDGTSKGMDMYQLAGVTKYYFFGTDTLGRDIFVRVAMGTRISFMIAAMAMLIDIFIGVVYGLISGYIGGYVDIVMQRIVEILHGIPEIVILTLLLLVLKPSVYNIVIALGINGWINMSRVVRAQTLKIKNMEYIMASKCLGSSPVHIMKSEILPNTLPQILVTFMFSIPNAIFSEAFLAYIGLGVPAPIASLGTLINDGYNVAMVYPHIIIGPIVVLVVLMLSFNLLADSLRDVIDPQMKSV